jgi:hypothetical protein
VLFLGELVKGKIIAVVFLNLCWRFAILSALLENRSITILMYGTGTWYDLPCVGIQLLEPLGAVPGTGTYQYYVYYAVHYANVVTCQDSRINFSE